MFDILKPINLSLDDLLIAADASLKVYDDQPSSKYGIACSVYQHEDDPNQVVVAFRGTSNTADIASDASIAVGGKSERLKSHITAICKELQANLEGKQVLITGHSLGGATAAQAAIETGWPAIAFDAPAFKSWARIPQKPPNIVFIDSQKNLINRTKFHAKSGFARISLSRDMKTYLSGQDAGLFASHRMPNIREVILGQLADSAIKTPELNLVNGLRHDLSVSRFNVETGVFGKKEAEFQLFQDTWEEEFDEQLLPELAALTHDLQGRDAEVGQDAEQKHQTRAFLKASRHIAKRKLSGLQAELKFWNKAKRNGLDNTDDNDLEPSTQQKVKWLRAKVKVIGVEVQRLRAAYSSEKKRQKALDEYRCHLNDEMRALEVKFDEAKFVALAGMHTPDLRRGVDIAILNSVAISAQARCDAQRRLVRTFSHAHERAEVYSGHASQAQVRHSDYLSRLENISRRVKKLSGPSWLHIYGNYEEFSANTMAKSGHPAAIALAQAVSFGNGLLQKGREDQVRSLQYDAQAYQALGKQAQATYSEAMGHKDRWMSTTNELVSVLLQNPNLLSPDDCHKLLVEQSKTLAKDETAITDALTAQEKEVARLEQEIERFGQKEKGQSGKKKRRTQREQAELKERLAEVQLRADQLTDSKESNRSAQRSINPAAAAVQSNSATLSALDSVIQKHSAQEQRTEDDIYKGLDQTNNQIDKTTWDNSLDDCFGDACKPDLTREQQRDAFAEKVVADMAAKGITISREDASQIFDDKLAREGKKIVLDKVQMAINAIQEKHRVQDQLIGEGFAATTAFVEQLKQSGLLEHIPGVNFGTVKTATKVMQMGQQSHQVYTIARNTMDLIDVLAKLRANAAEEGTKLALSALTGNYVAIAINLVKLASGLLQIYNTASDNHPEFSPETKAILAAIGDMQKSLEKRLDLIKGDLGYIRSDLELIRLDITQIQTLLMGDAQRQRGLQQQRAAGAETLNAVMDKAETISQNPIQTPGAQSLVSLASGEMVTGSATSVREVCSGAAYLRNTHLASHLPGLIQYQTRIDASVVANPMVLSNIAAHLIQQPKSRECKINLTHVERIAKEMLAFSDNLRAMAWAEAKFESLKDIAGSIMEQHARHMSDTKDRLALNLTRVKHNTSVFEAPCRTDRDPEDWLNTLAKTLHQHCEHNNIRNISVSIPVIDKGPNQTTLEIKTGFVACPANHLDSKKYAPILLPEKLLTALSERHHEFKVLQSIEQSGLLGLRFKYDMVAKTATAHDKRLLHSIDGFGLNLIIEAITPGKTDYEQIGIMPISAFIPRFMLTHEACDYRHLLHALYGIYYRYSDTSPIDRGRGYVSPERDSLGENLWHGMVWIPPLMLFQAVPWIRAHRSRSDAHVAMVYPGLYGVMHKIDNVDRLSRHPYQFVRSGQLNIGTGSVNIASLCDWKPQLGRIQSYFPWSVSGEMKWPANPRSDFIKIDPPERGGGRSGPRYKPPRTVNPRFELSRTQDRLTLNNKKYLSKVKPSPAAEQSASVDSYSGLMTTNELLETILAKCEANYIAEAKEGKVAIACREYEQVYATFIYMLRHEFELGYSESVAFMCDKIGLIHPVAFQVMVIQNPEKLPKYAAQISKMHTLDWEHLFSGLTSSHAHQILENLSVASSFSTESPPILSLEQSCQVPSDLEEVELLHDLILRQSTVSFQRVYNTDAIAPLFEREQSDVEELIGQLDETHISCSADQDAEADVSSGKREAGVEALERGLSELTFEPNTYLASGGPHDKQLRGTEQVVTHHGAGLKP